MPCYCMQLWLHFPEPSLGSVLRRWVQLPVVASQGNLQGSAPPRDLLEVSGAVGFHPAPVWHAG